MSVHEIVAEPLRIHRLATDGADEERRVLAALAAAGLNPAALYARRLPHELSGGQRQRVAIAAALVTEPRVLIADEPVSMLDVSIRAEILTLLAALRRERNIAILYITHDLGTVAAVADEMAVMYLGRIVERGPVRVLLQQPQHPYTQALLSVVPSVDPRRRRKRVILQGETPDPITVPPGCRFHPRCPAAADQCRRHDPVLEPARHGGEAACVRLGELLEEQHQ
jgi:oligopeptide/dipeptide ABC transporter ATP-binding protein